MKTKEGRREAYKGTSVSPGCSLCGLTSGETSDSSTLKASTSVFAAAFRIATSSVAVSPEAEGCTRRPSGLRGTSWLGRGRPRPRREAAVGIHSAMALRAADPGRRFDQSSSPPASPPPLPPPSAPSPVMAAPAPISLAVSKHAKV